MKRFLAAIVATVLLSAPVYAGAFGSALLKIDGAHIEKLSGAVWVDATAADIFIIASGTTTQSNANLEPALTASSGAVAGFDAPQSFVSPSLAAPAENTFASFGNPLADSYARGDTGGSGTSLIAAGGVSTVSIAEVSSVTSLGGSSLGETVGAGLFQVIVLTGGTYRIAFDAMVDLETTSDGTLSGKAVSDFRIQLNGGNLAFINNADANVNKTITGNDTYSFAGSLESNGVALAANSLNAFSIKHTTSALVAVPEPTSLVGFGLLLGCGLAYRRRIS